MGKESREYIELACRSINVFGVDGTVNFKELHKLLDMALNEVMVTDNEVRVMRNIMTKLHQKEQTITILEKIKKIEKKYSVQILC